MVFTITALTGDCKEDNKENNLARLMLREGLALLRFLTYRR